jgi:hypothetical protein
LSRSLLVYNKILILDKNIEEKKVDDGAKKEDPKEKAKNLMDKKKEEADKKK